MRAFRTIFSHLSIIFAGVFLTLVILNQYNPSMGFLTSTASSVFIVLFCLWVIALSVATIADNRHHANLMRQRAEEKAHEKKLGPGRQQPPVRKR
ncbi:MAG: hypothetical protein GX417_00920 [Clostridiales bacterium]|nr:hypothetical protein [Clostridiales bacterium]